MAEIDNGGPAFPCEGGEASGLYPNPGMTLRDWFATFAPQPSADAILAEQQMDKARNPYNDSYKPPLRSRDQIVADLRWAYADTMLSRRAKGGQ